MLAWVHLRALGRLHEGFARDALRVRPQILVVLISVMDVRAMLQKLLDNLDLL